MCERNPQGSFELVSSVRMPLYLWGQSSSLGSPPPPLLPLGTPSQGQPLTVLLDLEGDSDVWGWCPEPRVVRARHRDGNGPGISWMCAGGRWGLCQRSAQSNKIRNTVFPPLPECVSFLPMLWNVDFCLFAGFHPDWRTLCSEHNPPPNKAVPGTPSKKALVSEDLGWRLSPPVSEESPGEAASHRHPRPCGYARGPPHPGHLVPEHHHFKGVRSPHPHGCREVGVTQCVITRGTTRHPIEPCGRACATSVDPVLPPPGAGGCRSPAARPLPPFVLQTIEEALQEKEHSLRALKMTMEHRKQFMNYIFHEVRQPFSVLTLGLQHIITSCEVMGPRPPGAPVHPLRGVPYPFLNRARKNCEGRGGG